MEHAQRSGGRGRGTGRGGGGAPSPQRARGRGLATASGLRSPFMMGRRAVPASSVPDDLIQTVLAILPNKSRQSIVRQLQRTGLDVEAAINLLVQSSDDEGEPQGEEGFGMEAEEEVGPCCCLTRFQMHDWSRWLPLNPPLNPPLVAPQLAAGCPSTRRWCSRGRGPGRFSWAARAVLFS